jgi:hypothetical protein
MRERLLERDRSARVGRSVAGRHEVWHSADTWLKPKTPQVAHGTKGGLVNYKTMEI